MERSVPILIHDSASKHFQTNLTSPIINHLTKFLIERRLILSQAGDFWEDDLQSVAQIGFRQHQETAETAFSSANLRGKHMGNLSIERLNLTNGEKLTLFLTF